MNTINFDVRYNYDIEVDALFIYKVNYVGGSDYEESIELNADIILDFDKEGFPIVLEVLNASNVFKLPKSSIGNIDNIQMSVGISEKIINLNINMEVLNGNIKELKSTNSMAINDINLPNIDAELASV